MEPPSPARGAVVPQLHLIFSDNSSRSSTFTASPTRSSSARVESDVSQSQQPQRHDATHSSHGVRHAPRTAKHAPGLSVQRPSPRFAQYAPPSSSPRHPLPPSSPAGERITGGVVAPLRVSTATVEYLETARLPPMLQRQLKNECNSNNATTSPMTAQHHLSSNHNNSHPRAATGGACLSPSHQHVGDNNSDSDAFQILHPSLDRTDDSGELAKLMLSKWSVDAGEHAFASISLFCEMKLSEAKRMASWLETPNRFVATVCCALFNKYIDRLATTTATSMNAGSTQHPNNGNDPFGGSAVGQSVAFLRRIHSELVTAIFLPLGIGASSSSSTASSCDTRVPYFTEFKRLRKHNEFLIDTVTNRDRLRSTRAQLADKVDRLVQRLHRRQDRSTLRLLFRNWTRAVAVDKELRALKCRVLRSMRTTNLSAIFRAWRVESLRRAYQRESTEYQSMLSITAASLSRKDVLIAEAESKVTSMAKIIDSLTDSNAQLMKRIEQLEASPVNDGSNRLAGGSGSGGGDTDVNIATASRRHEMQYERIDTLIANDDNERMDRTNRMLLETMFGMARMVESCAIQLSKDVMDSLEYQLDGSVLQHLVEMIQAESDVKAKADATRAVTATQLPGGAQQRRMVMDVTSTTRSGTAAAGTTANSIAVAAAATARAVRVKDLVHMPIDTFLLHWVRMHLQMSSAIEKSTDRTIKNFTTDLADGRRYSFLLHRLFPTWFDLTMVHEIDADQRLRNIETFHSRIQPELPQVVTSDSIHAGSVIENVAFIAMLFGASVGSIRKINLERQRGAFLNIIAAWKRVRGSLLEIKRMNDNYDAAMVAHVMKEMRTCETLFRQLNTELAAIAIASNETSSALAQVAYNVLGLTWRCLHARMTNQSSATLNIVDERWQERLKDFSHVDHKTVRELLVAESAIQFQLLHRGGRRVSSVGAGLAALAPPAVPERDVTLRADALRSVLAIYSKDLHDIFKHYSASGGAGSIASMSLVEFSKFVKDCAICDKSLTLHAVESIYHATMCHARRHHPIHDSSSRPSTTTDEANQDDVAAVDVVSAIDAREMVGSEFIDALVRIAAVKSTVGDLTDRFQLLMETSIVPNAIQSQSELFRAEVASPKLRAVFQKHKLALQRVFRYYTSMHAVRETQSTIGLVEMSVFAKDCKLIGSFVTEHTLKQVLVNLQDDDDDEVTTTDETTLRADYSDFLEALAALTTFVLCNPYVPLYKRVESFVVDTVLVRARQKK